MNKTIKQHHAGDGTYRVRQGTTTGPVLFIIYKLTLQYMLNYYNVSYHFYADDTQIYFKKDSKNVSQNSILFSMLYKRG